MRHEHSDRAAVLTTSLLGSLVGHESGDFLVQRDCDARAKQDRTRHGRRALATHAVTYAATQAVTRWVLYRAAGVRVPVLAQLTGAVTEGALHAVVDDGRLLALFARSTGSGAFHDLGAPRPVAAVVEFDDRGQSDPVPVQLVPTEDGRPVLDRDEHGQLRTVGPYDNPSPSTGRALIDQGMHRGVQVLIGAVVTTAVAALHRRPRR